MALDFVLCLALVIKGIAAYPTTPCIPQSSCLPIAIPTNCVDSAIVQSLVDTLQLFIVSGAVQNNLNAPQTIKLPKFAPCSSPVLPTTNCANTIQPCLPTAPCSSPMLPTTSCNYANSIQPCLPKSSCSCSVLPTGSCNCINTIQSCLPSCSCNCNSCTKSNCCRNNCPDIVLPPLVPQLPCGCGYLPAAAPLVTAAYGALETCLSPIGSCTESYIPGSIPVIEPLFSCGCGCGCSPCSGCGYSPCSATIATPFCQELINLAQPIIL